jgi:NADH:ubiquinone oxidoreductase subunit F (NADH-binding)/NAD-dependent dihydropyrimidine dehydrogenase PreA subunit
VLEGMIIGAWAIGARQGFVFVRDEHVPAVLHLSLAVEEARDRGLLGRNILGTGHSFNVRIVRGAGSFVCGESTALLAAIEGRAVEPQVRYVHPAEQGLWGKPTVLSNAETWANVPLVAAQGDVAQLPSGGSSGTKVFTLAGRVSHAGLVEVPLGTRLRSIVFDIGGGVRRGRPLKAVQLGGPSGGCLPEALLDVPVDFDDLARVGATIGSGGLAVMDDRTCMVDVARRYVRFLQGEGCGKCVACREGLRQLGAILGRIVAGQGRSGDIELLEELAQTVAGASLCAVGGTAPNPVLTTIRYFRDEYEEHIVAHRCPAGRCPDLVRHRIDAAKCDGCGECVSRCPPGCIRGEKGRPHVIDESACTECGACRDVCEPDAVVAE